MLLYVSAAPTVLLIQIAYLALTVLVNNHRMVYLPTHNVKTNLRMLPVLHLTELVAVHKIFNFVKMVKTAVKYLFRNRTNLRSEPEVLRRMVLHIFKQYVQSMSSNYFLMYQSYWIFKHDFYLEFTNICSYK